MGYAGGMEAISYQRHMRQQRIFRYPHGYFCGGAYRVVCAPAITISGYEGNNFIINVQEQ